MMLGLIVIDTIGSFCMNIVVNILQSPVKLIVNMIIFYIKDEYILNNIFYVYLNTSKLGLYSNMFENKLISNIMTLIPNQYNILSLYNDMNALLLMRR